MGEAAGGRGKKKLKTYFHPGSQCGAAVWFWSDSSPRLNRAGSCAGTSGKLISIHKSICGSPSSRCVVLPRRERYGMGVKAVPGDGVVLGVV